MLWIRMQKLQEKRSNKILTIAKKEQRIESGKCEAWRIESLKEDIVRLESEITGIENTIAKLNIQADELIKKKERLKMMPETLKTLQRELAEQWTASDIKRRESLKERYETDENFRNNYYKYEQEHIFRKLSDEEIRVQAEKSAEKWIFDLLVRIESITGEITSWDKIRLCGHALNGEVIGQQGRVQVETIVAGGYNIQRVHLRALVKKI